MAEERKTISIDPRVALQETTLRAEAVEAFYRNRCLALGQTVLEHEMMIAQQADRILALEADLAELQPKTDQVN